MGRLGGVRRLSIATAGSTCSSATTCIYSLEPTSTASVRTGQPDYCPPNSYRPQPSRLYRNRGNGTFDDVTAQRARRRRLRPGARRVDRRLQRRRLDRHLRRQRRRWPNQLWINQQNGTFKDTAFLAGAAVSGGGNAEASMGVDAGDFDNDGDEDLFITNWLAQMNIALRQRRRRASSRTARRASGLGAPSLANTGFGTAWFDYDNDGWLDLLAVNGACRRIEAQARANDPFPLQDAEPALSQPRQRPVRGRRRRRPARSFTLLDVSRGAAFGDIDNDGDVDVVVGNANGPTRLLINNVGNRSHWLGLRLIGVAARDMLGRACRVIATTGPPLWRRARSDGSYASANDPRVLVGLGASTDPVPFAFSGRMETWSRGRISRSIAGRP